MDILKLRALLTLDSGEYESGIGKAEKEASGFGKKFKLAFAAGTAAVGAATAAVGALVKASVSSYAEFEQLKGGVETLFGDDVAKTVMDNANKAFESAGMSANQYMETAIQSSAAMINSLGGDQKKAAELTDLAITDMSDNVNKMGTTMESVQDAYRGFSRGNFTMLDNLALGFAGTKEGMQSLLDKAQEISGIKYDISSYSDIVQAIHVVQGEMGITGTTAKEAAQTISGSIAMTKSAWQNLITGIANGDADVSKLVGDVINSAATAGKNLLPAVMQAIEGVSTAFKTLLPQALDAIPSLINDVGVPLFESGVQLAFDLAQGMASGIPQLIDTMTGLMGDLTASMGDQIPELINTALEFVESFSGELRGKAGQLVDAGIALLMKLAQGIATAMPSLIQHIPVIISNIAGIINDNAPKLLAAGIKIIVTLGKGIIDAIPALIANFPQIIQAIWDVFTAVSWKALGSTLIEAIGNGIVAAGKAIPNAMKSVGKKALNAFKGISWKSVGSTAIKYIVSGIKALATSPVKALKSLGRSAANAVKNIDWKSIGRNIVSGITRGISNAGHAIKDKLLDMAKSAFNRVKSFFGISSPSKLMRDKIGKNIGLGMALGIKQSASAVEDAIAGLSDITVDDAVSSMLLDVPDTLTETVISTDSDKANRISRQNIFNNYFTISGASDPESIVAYIADILSMQVRTA